MCHILIKFYIITRDRDYTQVVKKQREEEGGNPYKMIGKIALTITTKMHRGVRDRNNQ